MLSYIKNCSRKLIQKIQYKYFKISLFIRGILGLPAQTGKEIQLFKKLFKNFSDKKIDIFEWGSGFSTIYYAGYLKNMKVSFQWASIDNNTTWHEKVKMKLEKRGLSSNVQLYIKSFPPFWEKPGWKWESVPPRRGAFGPESENEKAYIDFVKSLNKKFDIIIVDARFRRRCLETAKETLASGGVVILHDAQKSHYHIGLDGFRYKKFFNTGSWYPFQKIPNKVWVGSMDNHELINSLQD